MHNWNNSKTKKKNKANKEILEEKMIKKATERAKQFSSAKRYSKATDTYGIIKRGACKP